MAVACGAAAVGLVSEMPSGPGVIAEAEIARIAAAVPPGVASFLLTCKQDVPSLIAQQKRAGTNTIQLCDRLLEGAHADLRAALPGIALVQVIHVTGPDSLEEAVRIAPHVHALLLDSGDQNLAVKELGGTGRVHDWEISRQICQRVSVPVFLAGGLKPGNVSRAVQQVRPYGLDVCSGVRTEGRLDRRKLERFFDAVHALPE